MSLIFLTGSSGSGKTETLKYLEDIGYYCVDNLPVTLIDKFLSLISDKNYNDVAIGVDIRGKSMFIDQIDKIINLKKSDKEIFILYLDSSDGELFKRFNETRRKHPLNNINLMDSIKEEKIILSPIKKIADFILDTTLLKGKDLKKSLKQIIKVIGGKPKFFININSFGFKYGGFIQGHFNIDVRFLPNPYFIPKLKNLNGENRDVYNYVINNKETKIFLEKIVNILDYTIPLYKNREYRHYFNIGVGCTGGQHRSVAIAIYLYNYLKERDHLCQLRHREI